MEIPENIHEGGNSPALRAGLLPPLGQLIFFEGGFRRTKCHVVAQTQGYHLVCIWGSLVKFQGGGVVVKFDVFLNSYTVCVCCSHASNDPLCSVDNVPSQQAVKLVVVGLGVVERCWLTLLLGDQLQ